MTLNTYGNGISSSFGDFDEEYDLEPRGRDEYVSARDVRANLESEKYKFLWKKDSEKLLNARIRNHLIRSGVDTLILDLEGKVKIPVAR